MNNLKQIGLALHDYHDAYGCFPPAYVAGRDGRPRHSWRVLILPWLEQKAIYDRYRFDEPWDGPNNRKLHDLVVPAYVCPSHPKQGHSTAYAAVVGSATAWRGSEPTRTGDVTDGAEHTILLAEAPAASIHWMEPRDLEFDRMSFAINGADRAAGLSSSHPGVAQILLADGAVRILREKTAPGVLRALLTAAGGDEVKDY